MHELYLLSSSSPKLDAVREQPPKSAGGAASGRIFAPLEPSGGEEGGATKETASFSRGGGLGGGGTVGCGGGAGDEGRVGREDGRPAESSEQKG